MRTMWIGLGVVLAVVVIIAIVGISGYNKAIRLEQETQAAWAQVDNQLKRRFDLIPNLVETVKGYAAHEKGLFDDIAQARTKYFQAGNVGDKAQAATQLEGLVSRLLLLQEQYPTLKANESFLKLQDQLEGTENRIAVERNRYNEAVKAQNTYARGFPGSFFCNMAGVGEAQYFEVAESEKTTPKVSF